MVDRNIGGADDARYVRVLETHVSWLDGFTGPALGVLAAASGIYTYLGVSSLLDSDGALSVFAALAYSAAVSVGIFVFWMYMIRLLPAVRTTGARLGLVASMLLGSLAIIAMSSWLNAAALAGSAAVEQHLARTVQDYQAAVEQAHDTALAAQSLQRDVSRVRQSFQDLSQQEAGGELSGVAGRGAVFRVLTQKSDELAALEQQIAAQEPLVAQAFAEGNAILTEMRALTVEPGPVELRSLQFSEASVRLAGVITRLRQLSVAPLVARAAQDLSASVVIPQLDGATAETRAGQQATIGSVLDVLGQRAETLRQAAEQVIARPDPLETTYTPISTADAVIRYAGDFVPSWAGAIAIDLLPAVLVLILAVAHSAIRAGRAGRYDSAEALTLAELRAAVEALRELDDARPNARPQAREASAYEGATAREDEPPRGVHAPRPIEGATPLHRGKSE